MIGVEIGLVVDNPVVNENETFQVCAVLTGSTLQVDITVQLQIHLDPGVGKSLKKFAVNN